MNANTYVALKAKGLVTLARNLSQGTGVIQATYTRYNDVGDTMVVTENITQADVVAARTALQTQVANMNTFITDLQAAS